LTITEPRPGLWVGATCRSCGGVLTEVNAGHADGRRSLWVGACVDCRRQWVVTADICEVPSRGRYGRNQ
jgi:hypothetical protein